jgi:putative membrane protein
MTKKTFACTHTRVGSAALALAVAASLGACNSRSDNTLANADSAASGMANQAGAAIDTAASAGAVATDTVSNRVGSALSGDWSDADIVAYLVAADSGEVAAGKLASTKATNPSVKAFAKKMVSDHSKMLDGTVQLAKKDNIAYASANNDDIGDLRDDSKDALQDLTQKSAGSDWDEDYVDKQVDAHQKVIDHVNDFTQSAKDPQLVSMLKQALPKLQSHLAAAKNLQNAKVSN